MPVSRWNCNPRSRFRGAGRSNLRRQLEPLGFTAPPAAWLRAIPRPLSCRQSTCSDGSPPPKTGFLDDHLGNAISPCGLMSVVALIARIEVSGFCPSLVFERQSWRSMPRYSEFVDSLHAREIALLIKIDDAFSSYDHTPMRIVTALLKILLPLEEMQ